MSPTGLHPICHCLDLDAADFKVDIQRRSHSNLLTGADGEVGKRRSWLRRVNDCHMISLSYHF